MRFRRSTIRRSRRSSIFLMIGACTLILGLAEVDEVAAQRPFQIYDPFYSAETARRVFFDSYAVTTEVSCCSTSDSLMMGGLAGSAGIFGLPLGLGLHLNYQLGPQLDATAIIDAAGSTTGRNLSLSWLAVKYYWTVDRADYAVRLAVDPSLDGQVGFPQLDLGFISSVLLSPDFSSDFAIGARRVRMGYQQWTAEGDQRDILFSRAIGYELHLMVSYNFIVDPAGSNVFVSFAGEGASYDIFETSQRRTQEAGKTGRASSEASWHNEHLAGIIWMRSGITLSRPSYLVAPYVSVPLGQWQPKDIAGSRGNVHAGLRLMLR